MPERIRVAIVTETWLPTIDGVVTRLKHSVDQLTARGHEVLVLAPTTGSDTRARQLELPALALPFVDRRRRIGVPWSRPLIKALRRYEPDVVHVVNPVLMGWSALRAVAAHYPTVASYHTDIEAYAARYRLGWLGPTIRTMMRDTYGRVDLALASSPAGRQRLAALGVDATLWPAAVDTDLFTPGPTPDRVPDWLQGGDDPRPTLLCVGRLAPEKNLQALAPILQLATAQGRRWRLVLVGDGPDRRRLEQSFAGLPVTFAGSRSAAEVAVAYRCADAVVMPSLTETVGLVLLEAAACGAPVVAAETPATRHTVADYPATLLPAGATATEWVDAVAEALLRPRPRPAAIASWHDVTDGLIAAYRSVSGPRPADRPRRADSPAPEPSAASAARTARRSSDADS